MKEEIKKFFKGDIDDSDATRTAYSHDASIFEIRPAMVVFPKDSLDIQNLVRFVRESKEKYPTLSLTVRAAGTCMSGGPLNESIIVDITRYMNSLISISKDSKRAVVQPGMFYRDFEKETLALGLILPSYTASKSLNTVGGMVGNNSAGEITLRHGATRNYVKSLRVVFADGYEYEVRPLTKKELYQKVAEPTFEGQVYKQIVELIKSNYEEIKKAKPAVSKNSAGYALWDVWNLDNPDDDNERFDLAQLIVGSQGTLGIVTEITFSLVEVPTTRELLVLFLDDLQYLGDIVDELLTFKPESLESYDDKTFKLAMQFFGDFVKTKGIFGTIRFALSFLPEFKMVLFGGVPKLILLAEFTGTNAREVKERAMYALLKMKSVGLKARLTRDEQESKKYWQMRRDSFALLRKHTKGRRTAPFIDDIIVAPEFLPEFLPKLNTILSDYKNIIYTIAGHAGNGNFHIIPLMDFNNPDTVPQILELSDRVYKLVLDYRGSITAEHNDGIIRTPYLAFMFGPGMYELFGKVKTIFDPKFILNPKKKYGATIEDIKRYIQKPTI
jgi:FAD/FMN-containing dehydrogenase